MFLNLGFPRTACLRLTNPSEEGFVNLHRKTNHRPQETTIPPFRQCPSKVVLIITPVEAMAGGEDLRVSSMAAEVVFFDVETTVPNQPGRRFWILEFGAILVCPRRFVELDSYCTLIRPGDLTAAPETSGRSDGITRGAVAAAPTFEEVADRIFDVLNGEYGGGRRLKPAEWRD